MRQEGNHDIHVNLANVSYMDSTGLGLFVGFPSWRIGTSTSSNSGTVYTSNSPPTITS
jgi:anti-anti-sigma regulatory factor